MNNFSEKRNQSSLPASLDDLGTFFNEEIGNIVDSRLIVDSEELKILCRDLPIALDSSKFSIFFPIQTKKEKEVQRVEAAIRESVDRTCVAKFDHYQKLYEGISQNMGTRETTYTLFFQNLKTEMDEAYKQALTSVSKENAETMRFVDQTITQVFNYKYVVLNPKTPDGQLSFKVEDYEYHPCWVYSHWENYTKFHQSS